MDKPVELSGKLEKAFAEIPITRKYFRSGGTVDMSPEETKEAYQNLWGWLHEIFELIHEDGNPFSHTGGTKGEIEKAVRRNKNSMAIISDYHAALTHRSVMKEMLTSVLSPKQIQIKMDQLQGGHGREIPMSMRDPKWWEKL